MTSLPPFNEIVTSQNLLGAIDKLGFTTPTPVQARTVPAAMTGKDLIVQAQTGSGKTFAYVIPLLQQLENAPQIQDTYGLILGPTRELATQITEVIASMSGIRVPCLIGGTSMHAQRRDLDRDRRIVVGTPGRVLDFLRGGEVSLSNCRYFVLDEADEMLSMDFLEDIERILGHLPEKRQGLFISATISPYVEQLGGRFLRTPDRIVIETPADSMPDIEHRYYDIDGDVTAKATLLCDLLETIKPRSAIIFCNTRSDTELVEVFLRRRGFDARRINSDLNQKQRNAVMGKIRAGELRFLVGTDIAARGIDIELLDAVINYALPDQPELYVHRTGRTGRAGRSGLALSLVGPADFSAFQEIKRHTTVKLAKTPLPSEEEVLTARLAHFHELLDGSRINIQERDRAIGKKLLETLGSSGESSDALNQFMAKMYRFTLEHMLKTQTVALEDELADDDAPPPRQEQRSHGGGGRDRHRHGGGGRGGRDRGHGGRNSRR